MNVACLIGSGRRIMQLGSLLLGQCLALQTLAADTAWPELYRQTLKGDARLVAEPPAQPVTQLGLVRGVTDPTATSSCGPQLAAQPMVIGERDQFAELGGLAKGVGMGLLGAAIAQATDGKVAGVPGGGGKESGPQLYDDPIKKKFTVKVKDKDSKTSLRLGGRLADDGLILSTHLNKAQDKGTLHLVYLERDDCKRIYPFVNYAYEVWGKWSVNVSWTRTTSTYQNNELIDRTTSSGGWSRAGEAMLASGSGSIPLSQDLAGLSPEFRDSLGDYQRSLLDETDLPVWRSLGFGAPTSGARTVGSLFKLSDADFAAINDGSMTLVVHVTRENKKVFESMGVPMRIGPHSKHDGYLDFEDIELP